MAVKASAGLPVASGGRGQPTASESGKDPLDTSSAQHYILEKSKSPQIATTAVWGLDISNLRCQK